MHNAAWGALLRHIPADQQHGYMLVTTSGVEITIQNFLRIEEELLVFKGRLSGSQDQGLLFFIPYERIDYFGTMKAVKDTEFEENFGTLQFPKPAPTHAPAPAPPVALSDMANPHEVRRPEGNGSGSKPNIRSEVLERFRSRSNSAISLPSPLQEG